MIIDLWYPGEEIAGASVSFSDVDLVYRGNLYNAEGRAIGDFSGRDSAEIERRFPGIFGN